jgi:hypothetical protein
MKDILSLQQLMHEAFVLSLRLSHSEYSPKGHCFTPRTEQLGTKEQDEMIWSWADGLTHSYYQRISTGHCSPQSMIDFDIERFENTIKENIETMKKLLETFGQPIILTKEEMTKRGYKGYE